MWGKTKFNNMNILIGFMAIALLVLIVILWLQVKTFTAKYHRVQISLLLYRIRLEQMTASIFQFYLTNLNKSLQLVPLSNGVEERVRMKLFRIAYGKLAERLYGTMDIENEEMQINDLFDIGKENFLPFFMELKNEENLFRVIAEYESMQSLSQKMSSRDNPFINALSYHAYYIFENVRENLDLTSFRSSGGMCRYPKFCATIKKLQHLIPEFCEQYLGRLTVYEKDESWYSRPYGPYPRIDSYFESFKPQVTDVLQKAPIKHLVPVIISEEDDLPF